MSSTPNIDEMKAATETGKLSDAFRSLIFHDIAEEKSFIERMGEESSHLREIVAKKEQTIDETGRLFTRFNVVVATGEFALREIQLKDRRKIDLLAQLLMLCRRSLLEKEKFLESLDEVDDSEDEE